METIQDIADDIDNYYPDLSDKLDLKARLLLMVTQTTPDSESTDMRKEDLPKASPLDFHKQVEAIMLGMYDFMEPEPEKLAEAVAQVTALVQTLVPSEWTTRPDKTEPSSRQLGYNDCRNEILSTIKGVKADE